MSSSIRLTISYYSFDSAEGPISSKAAGWESCRELSFCCWLRQTWVAKPGGIDVLGMPSLPVSRLLCLSRK
jgi:hypothetical protein